MKFGASLRSAMLALMIFPALVSALRAAPVEYKLDAQDKVRVKIYEWRETLGELYEWSALNGELIVNASGMVSLPLIGEISATGRTPAELSVLISEGLQAKAGLVDRPSVIVEVLQYRPFYILGLVERPGEYPFRPGMTAIQAISIAGGLLRPGNQSTWQIGRDVISARGDLRLLNQNKSRLIVRRARLEAELGGGDTIAFPPELLASKDSALADIIRDEQLVFDSRRDAFRQKTEMLSKHKDFLRQEIEVLQAQMTVKAKQQASMEAELKSVRSLVKKGLQTSPRQALLERGAAVYEIGQLELNTSILRAHQDTAKVDESILDMTVQRRNELLAELQQVREDYHEVVEKIATAQLLILEAAAAGTRPEPQQPAASGNENAKFVIHRRGKLIADANLSEALVEPGDVVEIQPSVLEMPRNITVQSTTNVDEKAIAAQQ